VAVLFIDLDHFKEVNDTLGHAASDLLLIEAAHRLNVSVRASDTVARLGGDEFTVILAGINDLASVDHVAQTIQHALAKPCQFNTQTTLISGSIGIALYPSNADTSDDLLKRADQAMYIAKKRTKSVSIFQWTHA
jgi:diguanylate cyclase (GGDEF)-like protein